MQPVLHVLEMLLCLSVSLVANLSGCPFGLSKETDQSERETERQRVLPKNPLTGILPASQYARAASLIWGVL